MKETYIISGEHGRAEGYAYVMFLKRRANPWYLINQIFVFPEKRGKGVAKELLKQITDNADDQQAILILDFQPEEFGSDAERLMKLYKAFGFVWDEAIGGMKREPQDD